MHRGDEERGSTKKKCSRASQWAQRDRRGSPPNRAQMLVGPLDAVNVLQEELHPLLEDRTAKDARRVEDFEIELVVRTA